MNIKNYDDINRLLIKIKENKNQKLLKDLIEKVSPLIYNFPRIVFNADIDNCGEFYIYVIERFNKFIFKYDNNIASFKTWFFILLKSYYINWLKSKSNRRLENEEKIKSQLFFDYVSFFKWKENEVKNLQNEVKIFIDNLKLKDKVIIKLLYFPLNEEILEEISQVTGEKKDEIYFKYNSLLKRNNKRLKRINIIKEKIEKFEYEIFQKKKRGEQLSSKRVYRLKELKEKYYNNLELLKPEHISLLLNLTKREIYYRIKKVKKLVYEKFKIIIEGDKYGT